MVSERSQESELTKLFGKTQHVTEGAITAGRLKSATLTHVDVAALLGEPSRSSRRMPGGLLGVKGKIQKRLARERKRRGRR